MLQLFEKRTVKNRIGRTMQTIREVQNRIDNAIGATLLYPDIQIVANNVSNYADEIETQLNREEMKFEPFMNDVQNSCLDFEVTITAIDTAVKKMNVKLEHGQRYRIKMNDGTSHLINYKEEELLPEPLQKEHNSDGEHWWIPVKGYWIDRVEE